MNEFIEKTNYREKKVTSAEIIVTGTKDKPYFEIRYKEVGKEDYSIGYSSYDLNNVFDWKEDCFEIVNQLAEECKPIINYNTLLNDIKSQLKQFIADSNNIDYNRALVEAIEVIDEKTEEHNGGWIPCSKRLPETNESVLCWAKSTARGGDVCFVGSCHNGFWFLQSSADTHSFPGQYVIVAWQPLPDPYKEEKH